MTNQQIVDALLRLIPGADWTLTGDNYDDIIWHCECPKPTLDEIMAEIAKEPEIANAKNEAKKAILEKLGLTFDEVKTLFS